MTDDHKVDRAERGVRFGCGAVAGIILAGLIAIRETGGDVWLSLAIALLAGVVLGLLAAVYGDPFWERLAKVLWWFR